MNSLLKRLFLENAYYKLLSLALVLLLQIWVMGDRNAELSVPVSVRLVIPEGMVLTNQPDDQVVATLVGSRTALQRYSEANDISPIFVEAQNKEGKSVVALRQNMMELPSGLSVQELSPSFVNIELQPRAEKRVPLRVKLIGNLPDGYIAGTPTVRPQTVEISGPRDVISRTMFIATNSIDITGKKATFTEQAGLIHASPLIRDTLEGTANVSVPISAVEREQILRSIPVVAVNTTKPAEITPDRISLTVKGPEKLIKTLDKGSLLVSIDMSQEDTRGAGLYKKRATVSNLPAGVELIEQYPRDFQVRLVDQPGALRPNESPQP